MTTSPCFQLVSAVFAQHVLNLRNIMEKEKCMYLHEVENCQMMKNIISRTQRWQNLSFKYFTLIIIIIIVRNNVMNSILAY